MRVSAILPHEAVVVKPERVRSYAGNEAKITRGQDGKTVRRQGSSVHIPELPNACCPPYAGVRNSPAAQPVSPSFTSCHQVKPVAT
jgi:hypothetical protein